MKNLVFSVIVIVLVSSFATNLNNIQAQNTFQKEYGTSSEYGGFQIIQTKDSNYAVVGSLNKDVSLIKIDKYGNKIFSKTYGGSSIDEAFGIAQTTDGKYFYLTGGTFSFSTAPAFASAYLLKIDAQTGNLVWSIYFNGAGGCSVVANDDGGCTFTGGAGSISSVSKTFAARVDKDGNVLWQNVYGNGASAGKSIRKTPDGYAILTSDFYLLKTDSNGNEQWEKSYAVSGMECSGSSVKETSDGGFIAVGMNQNSDQTFRNIYVVRTNSTGDTLWTKIIGTNGRKSEGLSVEIATDGFVITGYDNDFANSIYSNFITKIDENGNVIWSKDIESSNYNQWLYSVVKCNDGGYMMTGQNNGIVYVAKADINGNVGCYESDAGMISFSPNTVVTIMTPAQLAVNPIVNNCATIIGSATSESTICEDLVGIKEKVNFQETPISIYPNPATDYVMITGGKNSSLQIFSSLGALVLSKNITQNEEKISLNGLPNGLYLISFGNHSQKIIKN
jgi:hypothetical protein